MPEILKVICVGTPPELLESRKLVLQSAGYDAILVATEQASNLLRAGGFDVMILSVTVSEDKRAALRNAVSDRTRIVQLDSFTTPEELLARIQS
jgi:hypothetical protein